MPDNVMEELLTEELSCNLPWSSIMNKDQHTCQSVEEFEKYLKAQNELQLLFQKKAQKCNFFKWNLKHYDNRDEPMENGSELAIQLRAIDKEVCTYF